MATNNLSTESIVDDKKPSIEIKQFFLDLTEQMGANDWKPIGIRLGIDSAKLSTFYVNNPGNIAGAMYDMLSYWWKDCEKKDKFEDRIKKLNSALESAHRKDLSIWVSEELDQGKTQDSDIEEGLRNLKLPSLPTVPPHHLDDSNNQDDDQPSYIS